MLQYLIHQIAAEYPVIFAILLCSAPDIKTHNIYIQPGIGLRLEKESIGIW